MKKLILVLLSLVLFATLATLATPTQAAGKRHVYESRHMLVVTKGEKITQTFTVKKNKIYLNKKVIKTFRPNSRIDFRGISRKGTLWVSVHLKKVKYTYKGVQIKKGKWRFKKVNLKPFSSFSYDSENFITYDGTWKKTS